MSKQSDLDLLAHDIDQAAHFTALHSLLAMLVRAHPEKTEILEVYRDLMTKMSEHNREQSRLDVAQVDPTLVQAAEGSAEVLAQLANVHAQLAEKLQEYAQQLFEECQ